MFSISVVVLCDVVAASGTPSFSAFSPSLPLEACTLAFLGSHSSAPLSPAPASSSCFPCHAHPVSALAKPRMGPTSRSVHSLTALRSSGLLCRFSPPSSPSFEQPRTSPSVIEERRGKANAAGPLWHSLIRFARPTRPLCCSCFGQESSNACPLVCKRA